MRNKRISIMAAVMAAILICMSLPASAAVSLIHANKDYRSMQLVSRQGVAINKPTAQFAAKRVVNGQVSDAVVSYTGYDCNTPFPVLECYVGDTIMFEDLSYDNNNGGYIKEWDWQQFGVFGEKSDIYTKDPLKATWFTATEPGEATFFLCVRNNARVKNGCCDPWSDNGNHQTVGKNKWYPNGAYWYFTAVRVVIKPMREAMVKVRYWDTQHNTIFHEGYVSAGTLLDDNDSKEATVHITDWDGYKYVGWNVQMPDGTIQYSGTDRDVTVILPGWMPEKYLNVEFQPAMATGVEVRYWDTGKSSIIRSEMLPGENVVGEQECHIQARMTPPDGYEITGWNVQLTDGKIQYTGTENPTTVILNGYVPKKYLNVECKALTNKRVTVRYIDVETERVIKSDDLFPDESNTVTVEIEEIDNYIVESWRVLTPEGRAYDEGNKDIIDVKLSDSIPHKIVDVDCLRLGDKDDDKLPDPTVTIKPNGECNGIIEWTETDSHKREVKGSDGEITYVTCNHSFDYQSVLSANAEIDPSTLKSGYGFGVDVSYSVSTSLISNKGGCNGWGRNRTPNMVINNPTKATVYIPWDMTNRLGTQSKSIAMELSGRQTFTLPVSNVSEAGARKIYTPVELHGTEEEPVSHSFEIYISSGGMEGVEFCKKLVESITINGDMYSDDFSGAD